MVTLRVLAASVLVSAWAGAAWAHGEGEEESEEAGEAHTQAGAVSYDTVSTGTRAYGADGLVIKILVEAANLGSSEVEVGEIIFPAGTRGTGHRHGAIEIFYVVEGTMEHVVNGEASTLTPGMVAIVRPTDTVTHNVLGDTPVKAVVIWAPGGEAERLSKVFPNLPLDSLTGDVDE